MSIFKSNQLTNKGMALLAKVVAGQTVLHFTKMQAGDGRYSGKVEDLTELVSWRVDGVITDIRPMGLFTDLNCYFSNETLTEMMEFRELGIIADDPDDGEILFCYTNAGDNASPIGAFSGIWLHEEQFMIRVYTANAENITAEISATSFATTTVYDNSHSGLLSTTVQGAIDELAESVTNLRIDITYDGRPPSEVLAEVFQALKDKTLLIGTENPTGSTSAALGQMFFNRDSGMLFVCVGAVEGAYIWLFVGGGSGGDDADIAFLGAGFIGAAFLIPEMPSGGGGFPDGGETGTGDVALISANIHVGDNPPADRAKVWYDTKADSQV